MDKKEDKPHPVDPITQPLGDLGRYQLFICLMVFLSKFPSGWVTLAIVFLASPTQQSCAEPGNSTDVCDDACTKVEYNRSVFKQNIIMEWDLICHHAQLVSWVQTITMFGIMTGGIFSGMLADRFGRRPVFCLLCTFQLVFGLLVSVSKWFWLFCLLRFLNAFCTGGMMVVSFVIIMEIVGKSKREIMSILYQIPFNLGHATLAAFAYFLREWWWYHFGFSIFSAVYLIYWCVIPESPRWLFTTGKVDKSIAILEKIAKRNGKPTETIRASIEEAHKRLVAAAPVKKSTMLDLFRTPNMRLKTIVLNFNWLVVCLVYYGVAQYVTNISGDIFVNVAVGACLGVPGTIICVPMTKYLGRKLTLFISSMVSAVALLVMAICNSGNSTVNIIFATIGLFGASVSFPNVYLYSGELFPTVVRNSGMGLCSFVGRLGSMVAPFVSQASSVALWIPAAVFGGFSLAAGLSVLLLPETKGQLLPETIEDGENFGKKEKPAQL